MSQILGGYASDPPFRGVLSRRAGAFLVDSLLIGLCGWAAALGILLFGIVTLGFGFLLFHMIPLFPFIYYTLLLPAGGTVGQRLFGIGLRDDTDLQRLPGFVEALVWSLLLWVSIALAFIPFLLALTNARHRAAHDVLSGLVIVRTG
jgi:uncharacterized RDD family membrane protein YckC